MHNISLLEACYKKYTQNLGDYLPEDIIDVDLKLLQKFNLMNYHDPSHNDPSLTRYFHVIESEEKITLINEDFVVWIVPEKIEEIALTYTMVALNKEGGNPELQLCFVASGVYNTSKLVLRVLEKFLHEIQENEDFLKRIGQDQDAA